DDGEDHVRERGDACKLGGGLAADLPGKVEGGLRANVVHGADRVARFLQPARHVGAHASDSDNANLLSHNSWFVVWFSCARRPRGRAAWCPEIRVEYSDAQTLPAN